MFFISLLITSLLTTIKKIGLFVNIGLGVINAIFFMLPMITKLFFYDIWLYWIIAQCVVNIILIALLIKELVCEKIKGNLVLLVAFLPLLSFGLDAIFTFVGFWQGGIISQYIFIVLFVVAMIVFVRVTY